MTWSQEISQLITDVDQLTSAANVKKSTLDASVASTEADKNAATASAASATASFTSVSARTQEAEAHKNTALAIYGTNAAQQTAVASAQASAALASGYAASASAALQQDLSGITATLHRSPNAITSAFIYDTSKDSDGGAWTEKCQNTSWYNEPIMGKWLGPQDSELIARAVGGTLGPELVTNGDFSSGSTGWTLATGIVVADGGANLSALGVAAGQIARSLGFSPTINKVYEVSFTIRNYVSGSVAFRIDGQNKTSRSSNGTFTERHVGIAATVNIGISVNAIATLTIDNISVREVTPINTASGDYFQLTTDGKFYRLWRNLLSRSEEFTTPWVLTSTSLATSTIGGYISAVQFGNNSVQRILRNPFSQIAGLTYTISAFVQMDDGLAPVVGAASNLGDFSLVTDDNIATSPVITQVGTTSVYRVSATRVCGTTGARQTGVYKYTTQSARTFRVTAIQLEIGSTVTAYESKGIEVSTSEVFRGNKRDFPRLAAIVTESNNLTIYDLTEPGRPMWMRFIGTTGFLAWLSTAINISGVSAVNGYIVPISSSNMGGVILNFAKDDAILIWNGSYILRKRQLVDRNSSNSYSAEPGGFIVAGTVINGIAMTVLPDAPTDPATGLKVPTIALANGSGLSFIRHNGTVTSIIDNFFGLFYEVAFEKRGSIIARHASTIPFFQRLTRYFKVPETNLTTTAGAVGTNGYSIDIFLMRMPNSGGAYKLLPNILRADGNITLYKEDVANGIRSLTATVNPAFNTGWMPGDIRRAYMSDIDAGSLIGSELVTNGDFASGSAGYVEVLNGTVSYTNQTMLATGTTGNTGVYRDVVVSANKLYQVVWRQVSGTSIRINIFDGASFVTSLYNNGTGDTIIGNRVATVRPSTTTLRIYLHTAAGSTAEFDNILVREAVADRSYKVQGAGINGTLVKAQLASGTSLVGYSGFSAANYLREPYSADLDFATGEFNTSAWLNIPATLPLDTYPVIGSAVTVPGWTNLGWDTFSTTGTSFTASKDITGGNDSALSTNTISAILGTWYKVTITVSAATVFAYNVGLTSSTNSRSTQAAATGTGTKVLYIQANVASGNFTVAVINSTLGSITVDSVTIQEIGQTLVFDRNHTSGPRIRMGINGGGSITAEALDGTTTRAVTTTGVYNTAQWLKAEANYTTDGSLAIRVNGREAAVTRGNPLLTLTNTSATLTIGNSFALDAPFPGSITLLKLGATVPTTEQSIFMYEQEKQLFRTNAISVLPDTGSVVDMSYDDTTDRWAAVSTTNESYWNGLVRASVTPASAGSYSRITATSGIELSARITTNPGVDVTIPAYVLREELVKRSETANKLNRQTAVYDYIGGFTGNITIGSTAIASVTNFTYPVSPVGARISGTGIPANTTIVAVVGTTIYISAAATATTAGLVISFLDFKLPLGFEAESVTTAGVVKQEGATKDYTRLFDGFLEMIRFAVAPGATTWVRIQASKSIQ